MKTGKTLLSLTVLSLSVYRFSQTFLVQQTGTAGRSSNR